MLTEEISKSVDSSVLCWLATVGDDGCPNVSPKEVFLLDDGGHILIANIASPQSVRNIQYERRVCVSFIDVFRQRGHKVKGRARILPKSDAEYSKKKSLLTKLAGDSFPVRSVIDVEPTSVEEIVAPSYRLVPGTTTQQAITQALKTYRVTEYQSLAE